MRSSVALRKAGGNALALRSRQRGIAAIEFAFVLIPLLILLHGIATFGAVFYTQHVLTRAAEDGARVVSMYASANVGERNSRITEAVGESLGATLLTSTGPPVISGSNPVVVVVSMNYQGSLPLAGSWLPAVLPLQGRAVAAGSGSL